VLLSAGRLAGYLCVEPRAELPPRGWLDALLEKDRLAEPERLGLLAGRSPTRFHADPSGGSASPHGMASVVADQTARDPRHVLTLIATHLEL